MEVSSAGEEGRPRKVIQALTSIVLVYDTTAGTEWMLQAPNDICFSSNFPVLLNEWENYMQGVGVKSVDLA